MPSSAKGILEMKKNDGKEDFTAEERNEIQKKFFIGFNAIRGRPELSDMLHDIDDYMRELKTYGIEDRLVKNFKINFCQIFVKFLVIIPKLLINLVFVSYY